MGQACRDVRRDISVHVVTRGGLVRSMGKGLSGQRIVRHGDGMRIVVKGREEHMDGDMSAMGGLPPAQLEAEMKMTEERMLKWFEYKHLPEGLRETSEPFGVLAHKMCQTLSPGPNRTVMLRKLLEARDAAVRAKLFPKG